MLSAQRVAIRFSSITVRHTITNGTPAEKPSTAPGSKPDKPESPEESRLKRQKDRLQQETARIDKKLKTVKAADDPNADPNELTAQARPVLQKMNIYSMTDKGKTELVAGQSKKKGVENLNLYKITLRREAVIDDDIIARIKREGESFESMEWTNKALCVYVWAPYQAPEAAEAPPTGRSAAEQVDSAQHIENPFKSFVDAVNRVELPNKALANVKSERATAGLTNIETINLDKMEKNAIDKLTLVFAEFVKWFEKPWARVFFTIASNHENSKARNMWDVAWVMYAADKRPMEAQSFMNASPPQGIKGFDLTNLNFVDAPGEKSEDVFEPQQQKKVTMPHKDLNDPFLTAAQKLDDIACDIQEHDPVVAFALDRISDALDRQSAYVFQPHESLTRRIETPSSLRTPFRPGPREITKNLGQMSEEDTAKWEAISQQIEEVAKNMRPLVKSKNPTTSEKAQRALEILKNIRHDTGPHSA